MNLFRILICLLLATSLFGQAGETAPPDSLMKTWDIDCNTKGCLMFLDIGHGNPKKPEYLTITVALNKEKADVAFISFIVPNQADRSKGLVIGFANSEKDEHGEWMVKLAEGATRILKFEVCSQGDCTARVIKGIVPASKEFGALNLLDQFLKNRMVLFYYWVNGERIRTGTTLSGFQTQYPDVVKEKLK